MKHRNKHRKIKVLLPIVAVVIILCVGFLIYKMASSNEETTTPTTSNLPTAQSDYNSRTKPEPSNVNTPEGTAADNGGEIVNVSPENQWTTSKSGLLTLYQPTKAAKLTPGATISGKTEVQQVSYRLVDNSVGVIAQGSLKVVGGNFSGSLQFSARGNGGTLEVFTVDPTTDREINGVTIDVQF